MCDLPFGIVSIDGKLTYVDSTMFIEEAQKHCQKDFKGHEDEIHHGIIAMCLFGADKILDVGLPNLYLVRGRIQEDGSKIALWYGFDEIYNLERKIKSLHMALKELLLRGYGVTEESYVMEHVDEVPGKSMIIKNILGN